MARWAVGTFAGAAVAFSVSAVQGVKIGRGWARSGLGLGIPPYVPALNQMAEGYCVSFEAPDGETGRPAVYALPMQTKEIAQSPAGLLQQRAPTG